MRTPIKYRHPQRTLCIFGDPRTSKETIAAFQNALKNSSRIQIHIEYCIRDKSKMLSFRPTSADAERKYIETFDRIKNFIEKLNHYAKRLESRLEAIEIYANSDGAPKVPSCSVASRIKEENPELSLRTPAEITFPRPGAFEVTIYSDSQSSWKEVLIFSKLDSERWPHVPQLSRFIERLIFGDENGPLQSLTIKLIHRAVRAYKQRKYIRRACVLLQKTYRGHRSRNKHR
jgi:hypothetical protein